MSSSLSTDLSQDGSSKRKGLLTRSNAMCGDDDTRLRPPDQLDQSPSGNSRTKRYSTTSSVSKDSTHTDYTDSTGIDLLQFIVNTLHKNAKDREMLMNLESEMRKFVLDKSRQAYKFPKMSSYNRMLVHRVAAYFGLDHNIDQSGTLVVVNKTPNTRVPDLEFSKCIKSDIFTDKILNRRNVQSFDECQLNNMYANFPAATPNMAFGSTVAMPAVGAGGSLSTSLEMVRRARSFEVGEWHNSMAGGGVGSASTTAMLHAGGLPSTYLNSTGGGASSSNSSSSWQLANNASNANIQFVPSRPESIVSPVAGIVLDPNSIYYAHPPPLSTSQQPPGPTNIPYSPQNAEYVLAMNRQTSQDTSGMAGTDSKSDGSVGVADGVVSYPAPIFVHGIPSGAVPYWTPVPTQSVEGNGSEMAQQKLSQLGLPVFQSNPPPMMDGQQQQLAYPIFYQQNALSAPSEFSQGGGVSQPPMPQYYIAQYAPPLAANLPLQQQPPRDAYGEPQQLAEHFQNSLQLSTDGNHQTTTSSLQDSSNESQQQISFNVGPSSPQLIPYNSPTGVCYISIGGRPNPTGPVVATVPPPQLQHHHHHQQQQLPKQHFVTNFQATQTNNVEAQNQQPNLSGPPPPQLQQFDPLQQKQAIAEKSP